MNTEIMKNWAKLFRDNFKEQGELVLIFDNLRAHLNVDVRNLFTELNITTFTLPPQSAKYCSVCDNSFFASLKARMRKMNTETTERKELVFKEICMNYPKELILNYWHHCGWTFMDE